jgi:hypothetical protein
MEPWVNYGAYDSSSNTLYVAGWLADECSSACHPLISVINHEFGHTIGWYDFDSGCETSIMSHDRDRNTVTEPSEEDMCWMYEWLDYCEQGDDPKACRPYLHLQAAPGHSNATSIVTTRTLLVEGQSSPPARPVCAFRVLASKR